MDDILKGLIVLLDRAIEYAKEELRKLAAESKPSSSAKMANLTLENLIQLRSTAIDGKLPRPSNGATLGLSHGIGEWLQDSPLLDVAYEIDNYYKHAMNARS